MIIFITIVAVCWLTYKAYQIGMIVERNTWRYGEHFIENSVAYRFAKDKDGNRRREVL